MKRVLALLLLCSVAIVLSGCASTAVFERQTALKIDPFSRTFDYSSSDFEVLGPVTAHGASTVVMGMVAGGHEGYGLLRKAAVEKYGNDVSTVMFIFSDYAYTGVMYPIVGTVRTTYSGTAVKIKTISHTPNVRVKE